MKVVGTLLLTLILSGFFAPPCGATVYDSNGTAASVQSLHDNSAHDGDTITLPAGTFVWTSGVTITKGITLQGQTTVNSDNGTANDLTIIQDSNARRRPGGYPFITVNSQAGKSYRITGLTIDGGGATTMNYNGAIILKGNSHSVRVDHMNWRANVTRENNDYLIAGSVCGVADHIVIKNPCSSYAIYNGDTWPDGTGSNGDGAFAAPTNFGGADFWFVEDNYIAPPQHMNPTSGPDDLKGGRWVWRHNHMYNSQVQSHGTEDGRWHGGRAREVYNNDFHFPRSGVGGVGGVRSGVTVFHDNTVDGQWPGDSMYQLQAYRSFFKWPACPFFGATGDNPWDVNDSHGLYGSGTATGGGRSQIIDTTKNWTTNRWAGFTAKFTGDNQTALIQSNTSNTLTVVFYTDSGGGHVWQAGDGYEIHRLLIALDQPGRGQGDLIVGNPPINSRTGTAAWPNQALEPTYSWNNIYTPTSRPVNITVGTGGSMLVEGRDYFNNTPMPGYAPYVYPHPLTTSLNPATLGNISTRSFVRTGDNVMIGGFIIQGTEPKTVIMRAIGPSLTQHGVPNALADPTLELHDGTGALIASNYNWQTTHIGGIITANQVSAILNSGYAPSQARESAIIATLPPGNYTAIVSGVNNTTGVALVDVYDLTAGASSILANISTRGFVQTGDNVMIGGFIIQGTEPKTVIMRAIGPSLTQHGVPNALADPTLELHDGTGALIASNYNWQTTHIGGIITANQVSAILNSGYAPSQARESAIIATLPPGNYTAIVSGVNNTTGVALVDVYDLQ